MEQNLRFKPGDKVVVRPDLDIHIRYQALTGRNAGWGIAPSLCMTLLAGQEFEVRSYSYSQKTFKLKGLHTRWTESMLIPADFFYSECRCESLL